MANDLAQDALAEQAVLASIFSDPITIDDIADLILPEEFFEPKNELIFSTILQLRQEGKKFDPISLASHLKAQGTLNNAGGIMYLHELINPANIASYGTDPIGHAAVIKENARRRRLTAAAEKILEISTLGSGFTADEATALAEREIFDITNDEAISMDVHTLTEMYPEAIAAIHAAKDRPEGVMVGIPTGFPDLDSKTNGFRPGQLCFIAARPGVGKQTALSTPVWTPQGQTTIGQLKEGDKVFGRNGKAYNVIKLHPINYGHDSYEIIFSDGEKIISGEDHLWYTETRAARRARREGLQEKDNSSRETVLPLIKLDAVRAELSKTQDKDTYTLFELCRLVKIPAEPPTMIAIAKTLDSVGQVFLTQKREKKVKTYQVSDISQTLLSTKSIQNHEDSVLVDKVTNLVHSSPTGTMSVQEVAEHLFGKDVDQKSWFYLNKIMTRSGVSSELEIKTIEASMTRPHVLYSKKELLEAYLQHGSQYINDQRHKNAVGSVKTTLEIFNTVRISSDERLNHSIPVTKPLEQEEQVLFIPPYTLGAWLGDGSVHGGSICGIDHEIFDFIEQEGYIPTELSRNRVYASPRHESFREVNFVGLRRDLNAEGILMGKGKTVREHGSTKHIPEKYFLGSIEQRKSLLAGLMDTDGTVVKGHSTVQFDNTNYSLVEGVRRLAASLGYIPRITEGESKLNGVVYGKTWSVTWSTDDDVFRISRKVVAHRAGVASSWNEEKNDRRYIVAVNRVDSVPMRCITVDSPDHLFLIGDSLIPTHNSTLAVDFCRSAVFLAGKTVLFFSLEMSAQEVTERVIAAEARVELQMIRTGNLSEAEWMAVHEVEEKFQNGTFLVDASPKVNLTKIRSMALRQKVRPEGLDMLVIDYLQLMEVPSGSSRGASRQEQVSELSRGLKLLAKELQLPIIVLSQLNRNSETRTDRVPQVSDLRESGSLEQDADLILLIHRPDVGDENNRPGEVDLIIGKQRSGPTGKIPLTAMLAYSKFVPGAGLITREPEMMNDDGAYAAGDDEIPW